MTPPDGTYITSAANAISVAFDIDKPENIDADELFRRLRQVLLQRIIDLLNTNPEKLMSILYRIDVSESKIRELFASAFPPDIPERLADMVIERQIAKAQTRQWGRGMQKE
ncbi:MAG: hypothetical protein HYX66_03435 [Ignavibacteria bacterium]|nr:hypothetical protein [Ignavibacteria bacterium]